MKRTKEEIDLRALACVLYHGGHVMVNGPPVNNERTCKYCQRTYMKVLGSTDPFVHKYTDTDITIRPVVMKDIRCNRTLADLPDWYVSRYGRR